MLLYSTGLKPNTVTFILKQQLSIENATLCKHSLQYKENSVCANRWWQILADFRTVPSLSTIREIKLSKVAVVQIGFLVSRIHTTITIKVKRNETRVNGRSSRLPSSCHRNKALPLWNVLSSILHIRFTRSYSLALYGKSTLHLIRTEYSK